jgi:3D (Asp-Asp-Asp) domain-containing protein
MTRYSGRRAQRKSLLSKLSIFGSFVLVLSIVESREAVFAAEEPTAQASQPSSLEIPGSFKELPEARDAVTAKQLTSTLTNGSSSTAQLDIDAEKLAGTNASVETDSGLVDFHATAYCLKGRTASGATTRPGMIAADPSVLPLGTVVHLRAGRYTGTYTVMDTGGRIKGRRVDVYVPTHREALEFGRRQVKIKVIGKNSASVNKGLLAAE